MVNYCPFSETEKAAVPGRGDFGALNVIVSFVMLSGFSSIKPRRMMIPQVVFWSNPVPLTVTIVPPYWGPRVGERSLMNGSLKYSNLPFD